MQPDLSDEDIADLTKLIKRAIDDSRYPFSPESPQVEGAARQAQTGAGAQALAPDEGLCAAVPRQIPATRSVEQWHAPNTLPESVPRCSYSLVELSSVA
jgi:hypothetical protein